MSSTRSLSAVLAVLILAVTACTTPNPSPATPSVTRAAVTAGSTAAAALQPTATHKAAPTAAPVTLPNPEDYQWVQYISAKLASPVAIANAGDGSNRLFVIEQIGRIRVIEDGKLIDTPFLNLTDRVGAEGSERGLLGLAFHPDYKENGYFYVNYTGKDYNSVVSRFHATGNIADPASEKKLLGVPQPYENHNGGSVVFGPDGDLYLGFGDGGSSGDPHNNGQSPNTLLGKILRIDVDHGDPYTIPQDNPFAKGGGQPEIWATGLRNPWRFSFDSLTGDMYIGDVGQDHWEEVNFLAAGSLGGANFGWNTREGTHPFRDGSDLPAFVAPIVDYAHEDGNCSITGGYVYRGTALPEWHGVYFYGDYCSRAIWGLYPTASGWKSSVLFPQTYNLNTFGIDEAGELYIANYNSIYRLEKK